MGDTKVGQAVLDEEWTQRGWSLVTKDGTALMGNTLDNEYTTKPAIERARQAALGHRLLRVVANARNDELSTDDWVMVDAIIAELRGGK